jgi:hypothetical protein
MSPFSCRNRLRLAAEVTEDRRLFDDAVTGHLFLHLDHGREDLADVVQMSEALRLAGKREPDQLVGCRGDGGAVLVLAAEVEGTQLHRADAAFEAEPAGERVAGKRCAAMRGSRRPALR